MIIRMTSEDLDLANYNGTPIEVGRTYILISKTDLNRCITWHDLRTDNGAGVGGNLDSSVRRYHGWRGTTNDISVEALGVRRVEEITHYKNGNVKIRLSEDLKPDEP